MGTTVKKQQHFFTSSSTDYCNNDFSVYFLVLINSHYNFIMIDKILIILQGITRMCCQPKV